MTHMVIEMSQALYREAEAQLLEGFRHTEGRPRDGFDALVMACALAQMIQSLAIGPIELGPESEQERTLLVTTVLTIGGAMGHGLIPVSPEFPFSAEEMVATTTPHIKAGPKACSKAVGEAIKRIGPVMFGIAAHFASAHPEEYAAFARLVVGDVGPIH